MATHLRTPISKTSQHLHHRQLRTMSTSLSTPHILKTVPHSSSSSSSSYSDIILPKFIYGTAWKKERSSDLVYQAIRAGFRAIDTAAQPRHYNEPGVADGIRRAIDEGIVRREELYIQTKYTPPSGQDPQNMPYSTSQSLEEQIHTSITSSLQNFTFASQKDNSSSNSEAPYLDALVLHSPLPTLSQTHLAWRTFSSYVPHQIRSLGLSNTTLPVLQSLYTASPELSIPPSVVQNRFYADTKWDIGLRKFCREKGIVYQSFWTLTGNPRLVKSRFLQEVAREMGVEMAEAWYALVLGLEGISVLNGTTNEARMKGDWESLERIAKLAEGEMKEEWKASMNGFRELIGETS